MPPAPCGILKVALLGGTPNELFNLDSLILQLIDIDFPSPREATLVVVLRYE